MPENKIVRAFPGLHYFEDNPIDRQLFFGRDKEIKELTEKIIAENITVLFGKSGDGKTSLINAGLKKALRKINYLPVRARIFNVPDKLTPTVALYEAIEEETKKYETNLPKKWRKETLWETFYGLQPTKENHLQPIVLILDQFEELFTLMVARKTEQDEFIHQLADLARGRLPEEVRGKYRKELVSLEPDNKRARELENLIYGSPRATVKILISLREDYLAYLDNLGSQIPKMYHSRYRLPALSIEQAREAIANPPQQVVLGEDVFQVEDEAVEALIRFLTVQSSRSGIREEVVGPPQLQVLCRQLEEEMRKAGRNTITLNSLGEDRKSREKKIREMLSLYYRDILAKFHRISPGPGPRRLRGLFGLVRWVQPLYSPRLAVRHLCEDRLITAGGNRNSRHEDEIVHEVGVSESNLDKLVDSRLIRREPRLQESFYELSHDSLVPSLQAAGGRRKTWNTTLRVAFVAMIVLAGLQWGLPYVRSFFALDSLKSELARVKRGEIPVDYFKTRLLQTTSSDTIAISGIKLDFDTWRKNELKHTFLEYEHPLLERADSVLKILQAEYPHDSELITELSDSLKRSRIHEVESRYAVLVKNVGRYPPPDSMFNLAKIFLDSTEAALGSEYRILALQADLAGIRKEYEPERQLLKELERRREVVLKQLLSAIKIRKPQSTSIKTFTGIAEPKLHIELHPSYILQNARVLLNGNKMTFTSTRDGEALTGIVIIPLDNQILNVLIKVIDKDAHEVSRKFTFNVDWNPLVLRSTPNRNLSANQVKSAITKFDFYCKTHDWSKKWSNPNGQGIVNDFELGLNGQVVHDRTSGLMWEQSRSSNYTTFEDAPKHVAQLNRNHFAGYDDWRLPTLEEAMSLMEPAQINNDLYINPIFDGTQRWIWTADKYNASSVWVVNFLYGFCNIIRMDYSYYICAVRRI